MLNWRLCRAPEFFLEAAVCNLRSYDDVDMNVFRILILSDSEVITQLGSQLKKNQLVVNPDLHVVHSSGVGGSLIQLVSLNWDIRDVTSTWYCFEPAVHPASCLLKLFIA